MVRSGKASVVLAIDDSARSRQGADVSRPRQPKSASTARLQSLSQRFEGQRVLHDDGFLIFSDNPKKTVQCAIELCRDAYDDWPSALAGHLEKEGIRDEATAFVASRLRRLSQDKHIILSKDLFDTVRVNGLGGNSDELLWIAHGSYHVEGLTFPQEIFEVRIKGSSPWSPTDEVAFTESKDSPLILGWRPARGQRVPMCMDWELRRRNSHDSIGELWEAINTHSFEKRAFFFIFNKEVSRLAKQRSLWIGRLKSIFYRSRRIVRVYDFSFETEPPFVSMATTSFTQLSSTLSVMRLDIRMRLEIAAQIAETLAAAHSAGVVHGAISPDNVLIRISTNGVPRVKLKNFAIPHPPHASAREIYASPCNTKHSMSIFSDHYAFGVVFYQLACGDLSRPIRPGWESDVPNHRLRRSIEAAVSSPSSEKFKSLATIAEELRASDEFSPDS